MGVLESLNLQHHEAKQSPNLVLQSPDRVIYAGNSRRRTIFLKESFPTQIHSGVLVGSEPEADVAEVVRHKIGVACEHGIPKDPCVAIIAADTNTVIPTFNSLTQQVALSSRGKPKSLEEVRHAFHQIASVSEVRNEHPFYFADSASAMLHLNGSAHLIEDRERCTVELDRDGVKKLSGEEGFKEYLREFEAFYSRPPYSTHNMEVGIADLSGGISLPVLVKMGLVTSVNGVARTDREFRDALQYGIHTAAIGLSPRILNTVQVKGEEVIRNWRWLNGVVDSALSA